MIGATSGRLRPGTPGECGRGRARTLDSLHAVHVSGRSPDRIDDCQSWNHHHLPARRPRFGERRVAMIEHLHDREKALEPFGWKGREAEWVALVCLHSGMFTRSQFCFFFDNARRKRAWRFVHTLVERGLGVEDERAIFPGGAKAVRISNKGLYRTLGS